MAAFEDFGLLVGRYKSAPADLADGQPSELLTDIKGRAIISGRWLEDAPHSSGDAGIFVMGVRHDADTSMVDTDGDYAPFQLTAAGRLKVDAELDVDFDYVYAEDSAHVSGDLGGFSLAVRRDARTSGTSTDGDYASFNVNSVGELWVHDEDVKTELIAANASLDAIESDIDQIRIDTTAIRSEIESITHAEDSGHTSGHAGVMSLGVRNDANTVLTSTDLDYSPIAVDQYGHIISSDQLTKAEQFTTADQLSSGDDGMVSVSGTFTDVCSYLVTSGTAFIYGWQYDCDRNAVGRLVTQIDDGGTAATGTATVVAFASLTGDTVTVDGVTLTEGVHWTAAASNNATATSLAAAINALDNVNASAVGAVVTITAAVAGTAGNAITLATSDGTNLTLSGATLSGGVDPVVSDLKVYKSRLNTSAQAGIDEHWSEGGRIEIPGTTNLRIKVQVRRRDSGAGSALASGSIHIRH